ncbi:hypothetical protein RN001_010061 [Aquatica leii]|uniref:Receptor expression-enhancing protein n=1 Tax=Aquatica leii TaxID=1421715 RepID=A0AAN7P0D5_9COLE|nr:hypothetical protein RN001_010061 [Aquatica leii]
MIAATLSRILIIIFGVLKPAYSSCKALNQHNENDIEKWLSYWIVFGLFTSTTAFTDVTLCWFPLYYELKVVFVKWLLSPTSNGALFLYTKFLKPFIDGKQDKIENLITKIEEQSWEHCIQIIPKIFNFFLETIVNQIILPFYNAGCPNTVETCNVIKKCNVVEKEDFSSDDSIESEYFKETGKQKRLKLFSKISKRNKGAGFVKNVNDISD